MKKISILVFLLFAGIAFSQNYSYYNDKKQPLELSKKSINIFVTNQFVPPPNNPVFSNVVFKLNELTPNEKWATLRFANELSDVAYYQKINELKNLPHVTGVGKHFKNGAYPTVGTSNLFYIKLKQASDYSVLVQMAQQNKVSIHHQLEYMPLWYALVRQPDAINDALELSNMFYETTYFANVDPAFVFEISMMIPDPEETYFCSLDNSNNLPSCSNDPAFDLQWGLKNYSNEAVDINACQAWNIATGQGVKIAIHDNGTLLTHTDLVANLSPLSFNVATGTSPSVLSTQQPDHGTFVAGICGASQNNNLGITGVAPNSTLISISNPSGYNALTYCEKQALGINWAWKTPVNADIINCSWGIHAAMPVLYPEFLEDAIDDATTLGRQGKGCIVVFASGNDAYGMRYPANNPNLNLLTVGAITPTGEKPFFSAFGNTLDLVAPGVCITSTAANGAITEEEGTSFAAPHVAGVAALMLSVNPCLTRQQVYDIIEQTAQKVNNTVSPFTYNLTAGRPNGAWSNKVGYGLLDAYAAVKMAQGMGSDDSYIKDNLADLGVEPNTSTIVWNSPDIWLRNLPDGGTTHQNATTGTNYVYVKVRNKGCIATNPNDYLKLYQTVNTWGCILQPIASLGTQTIPAIASGQDTILMSPVQLIFNMGHQSNIENAVIQLIAEIVPYGSVSNSINTDNYMQLAQNSNDIAVKSCVKVNPNNNASLETYKTINLPISNLNVAQNIKIELIEEKFDDEKAMSEEAEIKLTLNEDLLDAFENSGSATTNLSILNSDSDKLLTNQYAAINSVFVSNETKGAVNLKFNFLANEITSKTNYTYHLIQRKATTNEIINATAIEIEKPIRSLFVADAGDDVIKDKTEIITITAEDINEPAIYNWYDSAGNLVFTGKDLTISNAVAEKYKLEVIATADGFKDYTEVEVSLKPSVLSSISPNPATNAVTIGYKINEGGNAYLMILGGYGTIATSNNYILDVNQSETTLDVSNYSNGFYTVALVVNGQIVDAKTLIKE